MADKRYDEYGDVGSFVGTDLFVVSRAPYGAGAPFAKGTLTQLSTFLGALSASFYNSDGTINEDRTVTGTGYTLEMIFDAFKLMGQNFTVHPTDNNGWIVTANDAVDKNLTISIENQGAAKGNLTLEASDELTLKSKDNTTIQISATSANDITLLLEALNAGAGAANIELNAKSNFNVTSDFARYTTSNFNINPTDNSGIIVDANSASDKFLSFVINNSGAGKGNLVFDASDKVVFKGKDSSTFQMLANSNSDVLLLLEALNTGSGAASLHFVAKDNITADGKRVLLDASEQVNIELNTTTSTTDEMYITANNTGSGNTSITIGAYASSGFTAVQLIANRIALGQAGSLVDMRNASEGCSLPIWTTAGRPVPQGPIIGFNSETNQAELHNGTDWVILG